MCIFIYIIVIVTIIIFIVYAYYDVNTRDVLARTEERCCFSILIN